MNQSEMEKALYDVFFDSGIVRHDFALFSRDYDVLIEINGRQFLFRFTHCVSAVIKTSVKDAAWKQSWDDSFTDEESYEKAGRPEGYFWGVNYSAAYPGAKLLADSIDARDWSIRLGKQMWEVGIETNAHDIDLIFHDLRTSEVFGSGESKRIEF